MKTLISLITLVAIVSVYILSASLYLQGEAIVAYTLVMASISSLVLWIKSNSFQTAKA
ncbi:MAG TPA: hypothetical protein VGM30_05090 [Puia sp.]